MDEIRRQQQTDTYPVVLWCVNCGEDFAGEVYRIPKGTLREQFANGRACPRCGCYAIEAGTIVGVE